MSNMSELIADEKRQPKKKRVQRATIPSLSAISGNEKEGNYYVATAGSRPRFFDFNSLLIQPLSLNQISLRSKRS
jgi:hypothetical protein